MEELLQRYLRGEVSDEERRQVAQWLDEKPSNMQEFMALRKLYDISLWNTKEERNHKKINLSIRRITFEALKITAILFIGFFTAIQLLKNSSQEFQMQTMYVPSGQRAELTLADGTHVWLNSGSTLKFPEKFSANKRNVQLDGEGYFTVRKNGSSPFVVKTKKYAIQVLGTEFNVKAYNNTPLFATSLIKGSVEILALDKSQKIRLKPNEVALSNNDILKKTHITDYNYFKWKEGLFCFEDESIQDLIEKIELYYDIKIEVHRSSILQYRYSGKFRIQDGIEHILKVLQLKHKFSYSKNEEKKLIIIK